VRTQRACAATRGFASTRGRRGWRCHGGRREAADRPTARRGLRARPRDGRAAVDGGAGPGANASRSWRQCVERPRAEPHTRSRSAYRIALSSRLRRILSTSDEEAITQASVASRCTAMSFSAASGASDSTTFATMTSSATGTDVSAVCSARASSRSSSARWLSRPPAFERSPSAARYSSTERSLRSACWISPRSAASGERSSWAACAMNLRWRSTSSSRR
jgi:hypothetical protein